MWKARIINIDFLAWKAIISNDPNGKKSMLKILAFHTWSLFQIDFHFFSFFSIRIVRNGHFSTRKHPNYRKTFHMIIYTCKKRHFWRNHDAPCQPGWHDASTHLNCHKISIFEQFYTCRKSTFSNNRPPIFDKIS